MMIHPVATQHALSGRATQTATAEILSPRHERDPRLKIYGQFTGASVLWSARRHPILNFIRLIRAIRGEFLFTSGTA